MPLNRGQESLLKVDRTHPNTTMLNIPIRFNLKGSVDLKVLADVVKTVIRAHPALLTTIEPVGEGEFCQRFVPEFDAEIKVEKVNDKELEDISKSFVRPFPLDGSPMMRCRILEGDTKKVLLFDVSHLISDGWSLNQIFEDVGRIFDGKELSKDYCFDLLRQEADRKTSVTWQKDMKYFRERYDCGNYATLPRPDHITNENESIYLYRPFAFTKEAAEKVCRKYRLGKNGLYMLASSMAIADYNKAQDILILWTWNGRADARTNSSVGVFFRDLPAAFHIEKDVDIQSLLKDTAQQIEEGIIHGHASYFIENNGYKGSKLLCLIYQGDLYQYKSDEIVDSVELMDKGTYICNNTLDVEILDSDDDFGVMLNYNGAMYDKASMERFAELICSKCSEIISVCS